ncbi:MAG: hypothetical protein AzoDbin1_04886, partial [Azoarcus sp.]|nr:hypothetical protein [Azoarcus sp.]
LFDQSGGTVTLTGSTGTASPDAGNLYIGRSGTGTWTQSGGTVNLTANADEGKNEGLAHVHRSRRSVN